MTDELAFPAPRLRRLFGQPLQTEKIRLRTITPVLGGAAETRQVDTIDVVRAPSLRGQLRHWWRALQGHRYPDRKALAAAEQAIFGGIGGEQVTRSMVEVVVDGKRRTQQDNSDIELSNPAAYALWPARAE